MPVNTSETAIELREMVQPLTLRRVLAHQIGLKDEDLIITPEDAQLARRKRRIIVIGSALLVFAILFGVFGSAQLAMPLQHGRRDAMLRRHSPSSIKSNGATRALKRLLHTN